MCALGHLKTQHSLDREAEGVLLIHRRDIVKPIEIGHGLQIGLVLDQFFGAAMEQSDMRVHTFDDFAVKLKHETQNAVCRRVLRPEVDGEVAYCSFGHQFTGSAAAFAFSATFALKRSQLTVTRS